MGIADILLGTTASLEEIQTCTRSKPWMEGLLLHGLGNGTKIKTKMKTYTVSETRTIKTIEIN